MLIVILFIIKTKWKEYKLYKTKWIANSEYHMIQLGVIRDEDNKTTDEDRDSDGDVSDDENGVVGWKRLREWQDVTFSQLQI